MKSFSALVSVIFAASITTAILLLAFLLPFYYGVDPLGWGAKLGFLSKQTPAVTVNYSQPTLLATAQTDNKNVEPPVDVPPEEDPLAVRSDTVELVVPARQTLDYRLEMERDYDLDYAWTAMGKTVNSELRGESNDGKIPSKTFAKLTSTSGKGFFIIPFNGQFGWHWTNNSDQPLTIRLNTKGHYKVIGEIVTKSSK